jgi:hypothetical protein
MRVIYVIIYMLLAEIAIAQPLGKPAEPAEIWTGPPADCGTCDPNDSPAICCQRKICYCGSPQVAPMIDIGGRQRCSQYASIGAWWCDVILDIDGHCAFETTLSVPSAPELIE